MEPNQARMAANMLRMQQPDSSLAKPGMAMPQAPVGAPPPNPAAMAQPQGMPPGGMPPGPPGGMPPQAQPQGGPMGTPPMGVPAGGPPQPQAQPPLMPPQMGMPPRQV